MSEIADLLQQKAGLSPDKAQEVEQLIIGHITARVPEQFQGVLGSMLGLEQSAAPDSSAPVESGGLSGLMSAATSLFNKS